MEPVEAVSPGEPQLGAWPRRLTGFGPLHPLPGWQEAPLASRRTSLPANTVLAGTVVHEEERRAQSGHSGRAGPETAGAPVLVWVSGCV